MKIEITDEACRVLEKKGGTMSIDFIRPTGWGKVAEVSVDTNVKGKNLAPYRKLRHESFQILISPRLIGMADSMRVVTKGRLTKSLKVEFRAADADGSDDACAIWPEPKKNLNRFAQCACEGCEHLGNGSWDMVTGWLTY